MGPLEHAQMPSELDKLPENLQSLLSGHGGTAEPKEKRSQGPWSVAVFTDDKHVLKEMIRQFRDALGVSPETAEQLARETEEMVSVPRAWETNTRDGKSCLQTPILPLLSMPPICFSKLMSG